jgi:hypothetical protein
MKCAFVGEREFLRYQDERYNDKKYFLYKLHNLTENGCVTMNLLNTYILYC